MFVRKTQIQKVLASRVHVPCLNILFISGGHLTRGQFRREKKEKAGQVSASAHRFVFVQEDEKLGELQLLTFCVN